MGTSNITLFRARDIMTTNVVSVTPDMTIEEAVDLFEQYRVSGLPVVDTQRRLIGILTEYDLLQSISQLQMRGTVADFMTPDVVTVPEDTTLVELAGAFLSTRMRRVPVARDGKLVGVISRRDLIFAGKIRQQLLCELPMVEGVGEPG